MRREYALRYLLLRHLRRLRDDAGTDLHEEVARSLEVKIADQQYIVSWMRSGVAMEETIPLDTYIFYGRGDGKQGSSIDDSLVTDNDTLANAFAARAFGVHEEGIHPRLVAGSTSAYIDTGLAATGLGLFGIATGLQPHLTAVLCGLVLLGLSTSQSSTVGALVLLVLGLPTTALVVASASAMFQFLDPNPRFRKVRSLVPALFATAAAIELARSAIWITRWDAVVVVVVSVFLAAASTLYGPRQGLAMLILPVLLAGICVDVPSSSTQLALVIVLGVLILRVNAGRWVGLQVERSLTPNG